MAYVQISVTVGLHVKFAENEVFEGFEDIHN